MFFTSLFHTSLFSVLLTCIVPVGCDAFSSQSNIKYSLAFVTMNLDYKEYDGGKLQDSENSGFGKIAGYDMSLGYLFNKTDTSVNEVCINASMLNGKSDYVGAVLGSANGYGSLKQTTTNRFIDTSFAYKHTQRYQNFLDLLYGLGLGYHVWKRDLSSTQSERYEWYSLRPIISAILIMDKFSFGVSGEYQYGFNTTMSSANPDVNVNLGGADIIEIGFPLRYSYSKNIEFFAQYTLSKQNIKESNHVQKVINSTLMEIWEPDSTSYQNYLKIGATFKF